MKYEKASRKRRELFETHWGSYYWWVMLAALTVAVISQYPWKNRGDLITDAVFALWTGLMYLLSRRWPFESRLVHALGVLPILAFYLIQTDTKIPYDYHAELFILLSFFPIYATTAMVGLWGFVISAFFAVVLGVTLINEPPYLPIAALFWALSGLLGYGYFRMVEKLKGFHEHLLTQALTDPLTGLRNRRALEEDFPRLQALARREGKNLIFTLWDVNNLKHVNDLHGHAAGDRVLRKFARVLREAVRQSDPLYRIGGDEFAGLHIGLEDPDLLFRRVRENFPWTSYGWVDATELTLDEAYRLADQRLYHSKAHKESEIPRLTVEGTAG